MHLCNVNVNKIHLKIQTLFFLSSVRKSRRSATMMKHTEFQMRMQEREVKAKQLKASIAKRPVAQVRRLTQEELLEEAKITEKLNLQSLGK